MYALGIGPGDEVIVPPMTFAASANCVLYQRGTPVFADVEPGTLLLDPAAAEAAVTPRTKAIIAVDYAVSPRLGRPECHRRPASPGAGRRRLPRAGGAL